jgi:copper(I)-binding protein
MTYRPLLSASPRFNEKELFSHAGRSTIRISCRRDAERLTLLCQTEIFKELNVMGRKRARRLLSLLVASSSALVAAVPASADQPPDHHGRVTVENVWVTPANEAEQAILRLRILNETHSPMHLLGVASPLAKGSQIVGRISDHRTARLGSIGIRPDDMLDLTTSHLWIELGPLSREIRQGDLIPIELVFVRGRIHADAHVHSADG